MDEDTSIDVETTTTTTTTRTVDGADGQVKDEEASIEEEEQEQAPLKQEEKVTDLLTGSPYVSTHSILLDKDASNVPLGEPVDVLIGLKNSNEESTFHVRVVRGHLRSTVDPNFVIQNFTSYRYNVTIEPLHFASLLYTFVASPQLESNDYTVVVEVFYINENKDTFGSVVFNQTLHFTVKEESIWSLTSLAQMSMVIGMLGLVSFGVYQVFAGSKYAKKKSSGSYTTSTGDQVSEEKLLTVSKDIRVNMDFIPNIHKEKVAKLQKKKETSK